MIKLEVSDVKVTVDGVGFCFVGVCESVNTMGGLGVRSSISLTFNDYPSTYFGKILMRCDANTRYLMGFYLTGNRLPRGMRGYK